MTGGAGHGRRARAAVSARPAGRTKSGKPRPGTGGYGKNKLEGKGPTRRGSPAARVTRRSAGRLRRRPGSRRPRRGTRRRPGSRPGQPGARTGQAGPRTAAAGRRTGARGAATPPRWWPAATRCWSRCAPTSPRPRSTQARGTAPTTAVQRGDPAGGGRGHPGDRGGPAELDRLTGGAVHQGLALQIRPYDYAAPRRPAAAGPGPRRGAADRGAGRGHRPAQPRRGRALGRGVRRRTACWSPPRRSAHVSAGAWKASAGALARVPVAWASNLARALTSLPGGRPVRGRARRAGRHRASAS